MRSASAWRAEAAVATLAALAALVGCHAALWPGARDRVPECEGPLVPTEAIEGRFVWRERVRYETETLRASLELVVERADDTLVVVGLNELGAKAFAITQRGREVEAESFLGPLAVVSPEGALRDLHRARFAAGRAGGGDVTLRPSGCGYAVTFSRLDTRELDDPH